MSFFRADLAATIRDRTFSQCEIDTGTVRGLFLSKYNDDEWSFHLAHEGVSPSSEALAVIVRTAIGLQDLPVEVLATTRWSTAVRIAERYSAGRAFLIGDAAHLMPPWGGFNGNTGVADAHNLAWKIAAVLSGQASPDLLDS